VKSVDYCNCSGKIAEGKIDQGARIELHN